MEAHSWSHHYVKFPFFNYLDIMCCGFSTTYVFCNVDMNCVLYVRDADTRKKYAV